MQRYSANGTKLMHKVNGEDVQIQFLMEVPEFGGTPEKIDVTSLSDTTKSYITGIKDYGDLVFKFLYDNSSDKANYRVLKKYETNNTAAEFTLVYPDGTGHQFTATPAVKMDAGAINGALTFSCTLTLQGEIIVKNPKEVDPE